MVSFLPPDTRTQPPARNATQPSSSREQRHHHQPPLQPQRRQRAAAPPIHPSTHSSLLHPSRDPAPPPNPSLPHPCAPLPRGRPFSPPDFRTSEVIDLAPISSRPAGGVDHRATSLALAL